MRELRPSGLRCTSEAQQNKASGPTDAPKNSPRRNLVMPYRYRSSRRSFIKAATASAAGVLTYNLDLLNASAANEVIVGALYVGPKTDYGWNQAHAEGVATLKKAGVKVVEEERVPETVQVAKSMESMIKLDKANLIFATSFGYWDQMLKTAEKYPNVQFL